jgi:hypothetical protein
VVVPTRDDDEDPMTVQLLTHSWRLARVATAALALTAAALTVSGPATSHSAPQAAPAAAAGLPCLTKASAERVRVDSGLDGVDPNTVTFAESQQSESRFQSKARQRGLSADRVSLKKAKIDVYVHVITTDAGKGGVSKKRIKKQISVLNKAYAGKSSSKSKKTPFSFKLKSIDKTKNSSWYSWNAPTETSVGDDVAPKETLHKGGPDDLNLYVASLVGGVLGYATFPDDTTLLRDGVVVLNESLPGGKAKPYDKGDTLTHEVGHWLGLYHTFQNGCFAPGDLVDDTAYQADGVNIFSCEKLDTCVSAGRDPVHNFMSYGDDKCLDRFTKGQVSRMATAWQLFRAPGAGA